MDTNLEMFKQFNIPENTEEISKEDFDNLLEDVGTNRFRVFAQLGENYNWDLALKRNDSLKYFVERFC